MFGKRIPLVRAGDAIRAEHYNRLARELERLGTIHFGHGLRGGSMSFGQFLSLVDDQSFWATISAHDASSPAKFTWQEIFPTPGGTWSNGARSGSPTRDPAFEVNNNTSIVLPTNVRMYRDINSGALYFIADKCT